MYKVHFLHLGIPHNSMYKVHFPHPGIPHNTMYKVHFPIPGIPHNTMYKVHFPHHGIPHNTMHEVHLDSPHHFSFHRENEGYQELIFLLTNSLVDMPGLISYNLLMEAPKFTGKKILRHIKDCST